MAHNMRIGVLLPHRAVVIESARRPPLEECWKVARACDEAGLDIWVGDTIVAKPRLEPLATLAYCAAITQRARLGTAILLPALRQMVGFRNVLFVPFAGHWRVDLQCQPTDDPHAFSGADGIRRWLPRVMPAKDADRVTWVSTYVFRQAIANAFTDASRRILLVGEAAEPEGPEAPGLIVLKEDWTVESLTPGVDRWLAELSDGDWEAREKLPVAVVAVAGRALRTAEHPEASGEVAFARVLSRAGRWVVLHGATLVGDGARVQRHPDRP